MRVGDFLRKTREELEGRIRAFGFAFEPLSSKILKPKSIPSKIKDNKLAEEIWQWRRKNKTTYFATNYSQVTGLLNSTAIPSCHVVIPFINNFANRPLKHLYIYNLQSTIFSNCRNLGNYIVRGVRLKKGKPKFRIKHSNPDYLSNGNNNCDLVM